MHQKKEIVISRDDFEDMVSGPVRLNEITKIGGKFLGGYDYSSDEEDRDVREFHKKLAKLTKKESYNYYNGGQYSDMYIYVALPKNVVVKGFKKMDWDDFMHDIV